MRTSYADRKSRFRVLISNDYLLRSKIEGLQQQHEYASIINHYFDSIISQAGARNYDKFTINRAKAVTEALKKLWVVLDRKPETFRVIKDFGALEGMLFELENYRGHYIHQFNVFLLGYYILNKIKNESQTTFDVFKNTSKRPNFTWRITSTFHDMGYPLQQVDDWFSKFLDMFLNVETQYKFEIEKLLTPIFFEYVRYISETHLRLRPGKKLTFGKFPNRDWRVHNILLSNLRKKNHGVISALLLIHSLLTQDELASDENWFSSTFPDEIMPACHAIAVHDLKPSDLVINFREYPYAFLLALCDELQDWGRSLLGRDYSRLTGLEVLNNNGVPKVSFTLKVNRESFYIKSKSLDELSNKLFTSHLIDVVITEENSRKCWEINAFNETEDN